LISKTTAQFRALLAALPREIQDRARRGYATFLTDPTHPSLHFKQVHPNRPIFSARVGLAHRALCVKNGDAAVWFWIGSHSDMTSF
jgi:hypothetical protein